MLFKNEIVAGKLEQNGWVVIDFCTSEIIEKLKTVFLKFLPDLDEMPVIISLLHERREVTKRIHHEILSELNNTLDLHFSDYKIPIALFFAKKKELGDIGLHQDPMITDQVTSPSYGIWIPTVETNIGNGTIAVLDKSHRWFHPFQSDSFHSPFINICPQLQSQCTTLNLKPGQALIMDNRLVHYSHINTVDEIRPCVVIKITHTSSNYYTLFQKDDDIFLIQNNPDFYLKETWITDKSEFPSGVVEGILNFEPSTVTYQEFKDIADNNTLNHFQTQPITAWLKK